MIPRCLDVKKLIRYLKKLKIRGYVEIPRDVFMSEAQEKAVEKEIRKFLKKYGETSRHLGIPSQLLHRFDDFDSLGLRQMRDIMVDISEAFSLALPLENFTLDNLALRISRDSNPPVGYIHSDSDYFATVYSFGFPGPWVFLRDSNGQLRVRKVPPHRLTAISGMIREEALSIIAPSHSSPLITMVERLSWTSFYCKEPDKKTRLRCFNRSSIVKNELKKRGITARAR